MSIVERTDGDKIVDGIEILDELFSRSKNMFLTKQKTKNHRNKLYLLCIIVVVVVVVGVVVSVVVAVVVSVVGSSK